MKKRPYIAASCLLAFALVGMTVTLSTCRDSHEHAVANPGKGEAGNLLKQARALTTTNEYGVTEYSAEAFLLLLRAAELGNADAQYALAGCYRHGQETAGVKADAALAFRWYAKAAAQGQAQAIEGLANSYEHGHGVLEDQPKAFELHQQALAAGNLEALGSLAYSYFYGWGVEPDEEKAIEYSLRAAEHGRGNLSFFWVDRQEAIDAMECSSANVRGEAENAARDVCQRLRAFLETRLPGQKLPGQAQALLARGIELARQGDGEAAYWVARCFEDGYYMEDGHVGGMDGEQALLYYHMAVEAGNDASLFALGGMYVYSQSISSSRELSKFWYKLAAERGHYHAAKTVARQCDRESSADQAAAAYCRASALDPESWETRRDVGRVMRSGNVSTGMLRYLAGQGNRDVMAYLGECYEKGLQGVEKDDAHAALCYRRAADKGSPLAQYRLGRCYAEGRGVPKDMQKAAALFEQAAQAELANDGKDGTETYLDDSGYPMEVPYHGALRELAHCYARGLGVEKSPARALELYLQAGRENEDGLMRDSTIPAILADMAAKGSMPEKLADPAQRLLCGKALLYVYRHAGLVAEEQAALLQRAAAQGEPSACYLLSQRYGAGDAVPQDRRKALEWLQRAADGGCTESAYQLGLRYESGEGAEKDMARAAACYKQAAEAGHEEACLRWGNCLIEGKGTAANASMGVLWYKRAFYKRNPESVLLLADCYEKGVGVRQNTQLAAELRELVEPK